MGKKLKSREIRRILRRVKTGSFSEWDFEQLYRHYYPWVLGSLMKWSSGLSRNACEDLAQETLIKVYKNGDKVPTRVTGFQSWLATIARNELRRSIKASTSEKRGGTRTDEQLDHDPEDSAGKSEMPPALAQLLQDETRRRLYEAIRRLPARQQRAIQLQNRDMKIAEIAAAMGVAEGTVKAHLHAARQSLEQAYRREGEPVGAGELP